MNCPRCQAANPDEAVICHNCNAVLRSPRRVEGERKFVTVLFADVVSSTAMAERLDPEELIEVMNGAFHFLNASVTKYGGMVARLMGDAILAIFGAPAAHEDDPERAVRAGLEIQTAAKAYGRLIQQRYGLDFHLRVGIHSGLAVLAVVGDQIRTEYTAMGDTTNVAARLQAAAEPDTVLVSADTYRLVKPLFEFRPRGPLEVKGKSAAIESYEVCAPRAAPGKVRGLEALTSPLVGRDQELGRLLDKLASLGQREGAFVAVIGEAGLGKSRLMAEARQQAPAESVAWFESRAISYGQSSSYYLWQQVLHQSLGAAARGTASAAALRQRLHAVTAERGIAADHLPFLEALLDVDSEHTQRKVTGLHGDARLQGITEAVRAYLHALAQARPAVIVFDDLHWADQASLELLLSVSDLVANTPLLLAGVLRPDRDAASWPVIERVRSRLGPWFVPITLEPLSAQGFQELLDNLLPVDNWSSQARHLLLSRADGNPFYLEEVIRALIDAGYLAREGDRWHAVREITQMAVPDTLMGVLSARIDRLPEDTKRVAQMAAVLGRTFAYGMLRTICARAPAEERIEPLDPHLARLLEAQLLRERSRGPEPEYTFKHALTQEAAYNSLLLSRRREFHRRAGMALEELYPDQRDELAPELAHHFWLSEDWERAGRYAARAGSRAMKVYALPQAYEHYRRAVAAFEKLDPPPAEPWADAVLEWSAVIYRLKRYAEALEPLERVEDLARRLGDKRRLALALHWIASLRLAEGVPGRAISAMAENARVAEELGDERLSVVPRFFTAVEMVDSDPGAALAQLEHVIELAQAIQDDEIEAHALGVKAMAHARLGAFTEARRAMERALGVVTRTQSVIKQADVDMSSGLAFYDMGDVDRGLQHSERATELVRTTNAMECAVQGLYCVGLGNLRTQNWAKALDAFEEAVRLSAESGLEALNNQVKAGLAVARFFSGQSEAIGDIETTRTNARAIGDLYTAAFLSHSLGEAYLQLGNLASAERELNEALDYYRQHGMRPYLARALAVAARLYRRQGRPAEAEQAQRESAQLVAELQAAQQLEEGGRQPAIGR